MSMPPQVYQYQPLATSTSIRLVQILQSNDKHDDVIQCSVTTVDLDDGPSFDALSYTWGNPVTIYQAEDPDPLSMQLERIAAAAGSNAQNGSNEAGNLPPGLLLDLEALMLRSNHSYVQEEKLDWNAERKHPILCDGQQIMVSQNLLDVLRLLRRLQSGEVGSHSRVFEALSGVPPAAHLWIDAISINQEDVSERNAQVAMMNRIFGEAQHVLGWMGPADDYSRRAIATIIHMLPQVVEYRTGARTYQGSRFEFTDVDENHWLSLFAFLQRLWFRRAWIVQEMVMAKHIILMCGMQIFHWTMLEQILGFMRESKLDQQITELALSLRRFGVAQETVPLRETAGVMMPGFDRASELFDLQVDPKASYAFIHGITRMRARLGFSHVQARSKQDDPLLQRLFSNAREIVFRAFGYEQKDPRARTPSSLKFSTVMPSHPEPIALLDLLSEFRHCSTTDPRDKVFAMLDIARGSLVSDPRSSSIPNADYNLDVQEVYIKAAEYILNDAGDLTLLNHVQDQTTTRMKTLPSWVPDWSVSLGRSTFLADGQSPPQNPNQISLPFSILPGNILSVEGQFVDRIAALADEGSCYFTSTAKLALGTPAWYMHEPGLVLNFPGPGGDPIREQIMLPADRFQPPPDSPSGSPLGPGPSPILLAITRIEALWRTLVADTCNGSHPASVAYGFAFADWYCLELMQDVKMLEMVQQSGSTKGAAGVAAADARMADKIEAWRAMEASEVGGFYTRAEWRDMAMRFGALNRAMEVEGQALHSRFFRLENGGIRFLPDRRRIEYFMKNYERDVPERKGREKGGFLDMLERETVAEKEDTPMDAEAHANVAIFSARMDEVKTLRTMLRSKSGYLGMGPRSTLVGDEVWLLRGGKTPFILRPEPENTYRLVGEAYIHGIMREEEWRDREDQFQVVNIR